MGASHADSATLAGVTYDLQRCGPQVFEQLLQARCVRSGRRRRPGVWPRRRRSSRPGMSPGWATAVAVLLAQRGEVGLVPVAGPMSTGEAALGEVDRRLVEVAGGIAVGQVADFGVGEGPVLGDDEVGVGVVAPGHGEQLCGELADVAFGDVSSRPWHTARPAVAAEAGSCSCSSTYRCCGSARPSRGSECRSPLPKSPLKRVGQQRHRQAHRRGHRRDGATA